MNPIIYNVSVNASNITKLTSLFAATVLNEPIALYYFCMAIFSEFFNYFLKRIIRQSRPKGAKNCSGYVTFNTVSKSFGMPSGHSESMGLFTTFWLLYLYDMYKKKGLSSLNIVGLVFILITGIYVPYSRIVVGCHSVSQVIIGYIVGIILGVISYKIYDIYLEEYFERQKDIIIFKDILKYN